MADLQHAAQLALAALHESIDDVISSLNVYPPHPANRRRRQAIEEQVQRHQTAIGALTAALGVPERLSPADQQGNGAGGQSRG